MLCHLIMGQLAIHQAAMEDAHTLTQPQLSIMDRLGHGCQTTTGLRLRQHLLCKL